MDFIRKYDIELQKEHYYAGETLHGWVVIENLENLRVTGVQVYLRGKAHVEWRITRGGERRTVKEDQYFIDEKVIVWGKENGDEGNVSIMPRGDHRFPFEFQLPASCLPCSFESRVGTVRYYLRVIIDIPYASPPQGLKYFTVIGPYIDCLDEQYNKPQSANKQMSSSCLCCTSGPVNLEAWIERAAYCCGENIKLKCDIQNGSDQDVSLFCRLLQNVEYKINKGVMGLSKDVSHQVIEFHSQAVLPHSTKSFYELCNDLQVPVMPPTMTEVCRVIEIYYVLKVGLHLEKSGDDLQVEFPFIVATVPHRTLSLNIPDLSYEPADDHVEGGIYISPEFQLGQVYDGAADLVEDVILYRPVYICIPRHTTEILSNGHSPSSQTERPMIMSSSDNRKKLDEELVKTRKFDCLEQASSQHADSMRNLFQLQSDQFNENAEKLDVGLAGYDILNKNDNLKCEFTNDMENYSEKLCSHIAENETKKHLEFVNIELNTAQRKTQHIDQRDVLDSLSKIKFQTVFDETTVSKQIAGSQLQWTEIQNNLKISEQASENNEQNNYTKTSSTTIKEQAADVECLNYQRGAQFDSKSASKSSCVETYEESSGQTIKSA